MSNDRIAEIRARCEAATPGPWKVKIHNEEYGQGYGEITYFVDIEGELLKIGLADNNRLLVKYRSDTDFIAHSREDIPYLLSKLSEQEKMHWVSVNAGADAIRQLKEWLAERDREIERLREAQRWRNAETEPPKCEDGAETGPILYRMKTTGTIEVGYYGRKGRWRDSYFRHMRNASDGVDADDVSDWMPLPAAPEVEAEAALAGKDVEE